MCLSAPKPSMYAAAPRRYVSPLVKIDVRRVENRIRRVADSSLPPAVPYERRNRLKEPNIGGRLANTSTLCIYTASGFSLLLLLIPSSSRQRTISAFAKKSRKLGHDLLDCSGWICMYTVALKR